MRLPTPSYFTGMSLKRKETTTSIKHDICNHVTVYAKNNNKTEKKNILRTKNERRFPFWFKFPKGTAFSRFFGKEDNFESFAQNF